MSNTSTATPPPPKTAPDYTKDRSLPGVPPEHRAVYLRVLDGRASEREAIAMFCGECAGWDKREIADCRATGCPLFSCRPYKPAPADRPRRAS